MYGALCGGLGVMMIHGDVTKKRSNRRQKETAPQRIAARSPPQSDVENSDNRGLYIAGRTLVR